MPAKKKRFFSSSVLQPSLFSKQSKLIISGKKKDLVSLTLQKMLAKKLVFGTHRKKGKTTKVKRIVETHLKRLGLSGFVDLEAFFTGLVEVARQAEKLEGGILYHIDFFEEKIVSNPRIVKRFKGYKSALPEIRESVREILYWMSVAEKARRLRKKFRFFNF
jgi:hypothetical protein